MLWVFLHSLMFILITLQLLFFLRVSENFSNLVKLIRTVFSRIVPFTMFLLIWMLLNCLLYKIGGYTLIWEENGTQYNHVFLFVGIFL